MSENLTLIAAGSTGADAGWASRCNYWLSLHATPERRPRRRKNREPLILSGHGVHLRVNHGALVIRNGFTHYPQEIEEHRFFPRDRNLPSRIILIEGNGSLSFDALSWLAEQLIPLIQLDWRGNVICVAGADTSRDPKKVVRQFAALQSGRAAIIASSLIGQKLSNCISTLNSALPENPQVNSAIDQLHADLELIKRRPPKTISGLLGIEGRAAYSYFRAWQDMPLRWKGVGRHPIPQDWYRVGPRQSYSRQKGRNRHATHPVNAMLNYAYRILESEIRIQVAAEGYDPTIGYLHTYKADRPAFVFDLMEPLRPIIDRKILEFVEAQTFHPSDFTIRADGVCRLNPAMARIIALRCAINTVLRPKKIVLV